MGNALHRRSVRKKTFEFGALTLLSRILGAIREALLIRLLGISAFSDAFIMAFRIPSSLRKVFAEGALSAAFVPVFIKISKNDNKNDGSRLMAAAFLFFEGIVLGLCILAWLYPEAIIRLVASGFSDEQMVFAVKYLRILFPFIFFISSSALLAGALQAENHFFMIAFAPVLLNIFYVASLLLCLYYGYSISFLCFGILAGGMAQLIFYFLFYFDFGYVFLIPNRESWKTFRKIITKFGNCLFGVSIMEINFIIDGNIATYIGAGAPSVLYYGNRFMQIPLSIFAVAFSTVLLTYFSRLLLYAPRRLSFLLLEASKFIFWAIIPSMIFLMFISGRLFSTLIMTKGVSAVHIWQSQWVLIIMATGLLFFSLNKILTNVFYAFNDTVTPTIIGVIATIANLIGNLLSLVFLGDLAIFGIAASTMFSGLVFTVCAFMFLHFKYKFQFYIVPFMDFLLRYLVQMSLAIALFCSIHYAFFYFMKFNSWYFFFYQQWGYWFFSIPLAGMIAFLLFSTRKMFKIELYFL